MTQHLLDITSAAGRLGVAPKTLYKWVHLRRIPFVKVGRLVRFRVGDLDDWIEARIQPTIGEILASGRGGGRD